MKILHINAGLESGGGLTHIISLLRGQNDAELLTLAEGPVAAAAREAGIKVSVMQHQSRYSLSVLRDLRQFINQGQFDIVHTHGPRANLFVNLIRRRIQAKWVITVHSDPKLDFMQGGIVGRIFTHLNIASLKHAAQIDVVTKRFEQQLLTLGVKPQRMRVIYNGIDFHSGPMTPVEHDAFTLMIVARLHPVKDHKLLLNAFKAADIPAVLNIVGDGPEMDHIKQQIAALDLSDRVHLLGFKTQDEIRQLQATTDMTVLTSQSESFPLVLLESADAGIPVLTTDVGDMQVMVPSTDYGFVIPVGDQHALVNALQMAYKDYQAGILPTMGAAFRAYASEHFSIKELQTSVWAGYQQLLQ